MDTIIRLRSSLYAVLDYLDDEHEDYKAHPSANHIWLALDDLKRFVDFLDESPDPEINLELLCFRS